MRRPGPKMVYFIRPVGIEGPVKIGSSVSPDGRRKTLETWSPFPLEIIAQLPGDTKIEQRFHTLFKGQHRRREWFDWSPMMAEVVAAINAGTFDRESLPEPMGISHYVDGRKRERSLSFRKQLSLSLRYTHTCRRTGYESPICPYGIIARNDPDELRMIEDYLRDPARHGKPINSEWAERARQKLAA